ncbi:MAG: tetratricopeptide repeat protein [Alphaproteobacteria bacterium]|nr:MAG: tetratricopeptide repeat protein [Alphaproteobacteria bacterium]
MTRTKRSLAILLAVAGISGAVSAQSLTLHVTRDYYLDHGDRALAAGETLKAADYFRKALRKNLSADERIAAQNSLCAAEFILGNYDAASEACTAAIRADGGYWKAYVNRGNARNALGDTEGAIADYCEAKALEPGKVDGDFASYCPA